jgi:hypothetical protein
VDGVHGRGVDYLIVALEDIVRLLRSPISFYVVVGVIVDVW